MIKSIQFYPGVCFILNFLIHRARQAKSKAREGQFYELAEKAKGRADTKQVKLIKELEFDCLFFNSLHAIPTDCHIYNRWS